MIAALLFSVVTARAEPPPLAITTPAAGISAHFKLPRNEDFAEIKAAGFTWLRVDLAWADTEKTRGVYDFSAFDRLAAAIHAEGFSAVVILAYGNALYVNPGDPPGSRTRADTDAFREAFARWAATAVERYAKYNFIWELWNEPNSTKFWAPKENVREYVSLMRTAAHAIHAKTPGARLIGPATTGVDIRFIRACLEGGMLDYWSAISVHPYRKRAPETVKDAYQKLREEIARHAPRGREIPIICSEWGHPSDGSPESLARQADYLSGVLSTNFGENIPLTFWYTWTPHPDDPADGKFALAKRYRNSDGNISFRFTPAFGRAGELLNKNKSNR